MKKSALLLFSVSFLLIFSSCTKFIFIEKTLDPEIIPQKKNGTIVFVNLFNYTSPAYVKEKNVAPYRSGVKKLTEGLSLIPPGDKLYNFVIGDTLRKGIDAGMLTALLPIDSVTAICKQYNADMLLALDSMNIFFDWETIVENSDDGSKSKTKNFYLYTNFFLSLYTSAGDLMNRSKVENSTFYKSRPTLSGLITIQPSMVKATGSIEQLAFQAGQDYVDKFYPRTENESRLIYSGKPFKESNAYLETGNWDKAIELLEPLTRSPDSGIATKARQNLYVAKEAMEAARMKK
jgi:hypothetical protein